LYIRRSRSIAIQAAATSSSVPRHGAGRDLGQHLLVEPFLADPQYPAQLEQRIVFVAAVFDMRVM
jgi:hypothetical protein